MIIAVDPGASGGIAISDDKGKGVSAYSMPDTDKDVISLLTELVNLSNSNNEECRCVVEMVGGFIGAGQPGSAMFNFGHGVGIIVGCLLTLNVRIERPRPQSWQKTLSLGTRSKTMSKTEWKNKLKAKAQELFPDVKVTLKTADALLILEAARRTSF